MVVNQGVDNSIDSIEVAEGLSVMYRFHIIQ